MRIFVALACLLPLGLAAEAGINKHSPEAAVRAVYEADQPSIDGKGAGVMGNPALRARFFSRSLARTFGDGLPSPDGPQAKEAAMADPLIDQAPHMVGLTIAPVSESRDAAKVLAEFARGDGARERLTYAMVFERGEWRIDDIAYTFLDGESHTLRGSLTTD